MYLPGCNARTGDNTAPFTTYRRGQRVGARIGRFEREMMMAVPATASQPQSERVVLSGIPSELKAVTRFQIVNTARPFTQRTSNKFCIVSF